MAASAGVCLSVFYLPNLSTNYMDRPPKRDWRDWFIMATVVGGVGYGMYFVAKVTNPDNCSHVLPY